MILNSPKLPRYIKQMILMSGKSWWQVMYADGRYLSEWDTFAPPKVEDELSLVEKSFIAKLITQGLKPFTALPLASRSGTSRWEEIPKAGLRNLFLICPVGAPGVAAFQAEADYLFFQLKVGIAAVGADRTCLSHLIGKVDNNKGDCTCYAWDYRTKTINRFNDNVTNMAYENLGALSLDVLGLNQPVV